MWFLLFYGSSVGWAQSPEHFKLRDKIKQTTESIDQSKQQKKSMLDRLRQAEVSRGQLMVAVQSTTKKLNVKKLSLQQVQVSVVQMQRDLKEKKVAFNYYLNQSYVLSRQPPLKLLLDQKNSASVDRVVTYHAFLNQDLETQMKSIQALILQLQARKKRLQLQQRVIRSLKRNYSQQLTQLRAQQRHRRRIVKQLNTALRTQHQRLKRYQSDQHQLDKTLKGLSSLKENLPQAVFSRLKGRLRWPVRGRVVRLFGKSVDRSELRWGGVLIHTQKEQPVRAIADGRVVYARWLSGYGLLVIINHSHGYMSLYGRNLNVFKKAGDVVRKGEIISTAGNSGGFKQTALYFAIRHNAQPLNPQRWCR